MVKVHISINTRDKVKLNQVKLKVKMRNFSWSLVDSKRFDFFYNVFTKVYFVPKD